MSAVVAAPIALRRSRSVLGQLARKEIRRYATHPLFLLGVVLAAVTSIEQPDEVMSSLGNVIAPATAFGVFGLLVMSSLVRGSDQAAASAGVTAAGERTRTLALAASVVVPLTASLGWLAWAVWAFHRWPTAPRGIIFGPVGDAWAYGVLVALGVLPAVGGPLLGLVLARWANARGAAPIAACVLVLVTVCLQGLFEPIRYGRVFAPWTYFGGPYGTTADPDRVLLLSGSPQWYCGYLGALCALGVVVALLHDREAPRQRLFVGLAVVAAVALTLGTLAMTQGVPETIINPLSASRS
ncbi:MAG TPA: hypothetical protein VFL99_07120 [Segeticoccus sp.]|uniref:hypothetical protein n=1 Tax=Segeticoccus sp. TaxID=2706531 RepID=UPI002D7E4EB0|nr:hypothetical protein [Segeticoccus sp.]HET8600080.1 hypothetical protein [Segeticoccus sp.]